MEKQSPKHSKHQFSIAFKINKSARHFSICQQRLLKKMLADLENSLAQVLKVH